MSEDQRCLETRQIVGNFHQYLIMAYCLSDRGGRESGESKTEL